MRLHFKGNASISQMILSKAFPCATYKRQTLFVKIERFEAIVILFDVMERERGHPGDGWRYEKGYIAKFNSREVYLK